MEGSPYNPYGDRRQPTFGLLRLLLAAGALVAIAGAVMGIVFVSTGSLVRFENDLTGGRSGADSEAVSQLEYPAQLVQQLPQPAGGSWLLPAAAVPVEDGVFVLDAGNDRLLKLDHHGELVASLEGLNLAQPIAAASDGERLYVVGPLSSEVVVLDASGQVERRLDLRSLAAGARVPRPIGVAATPDGGIAVSDAANHQVLILDGGGGLVRAVGRGGRAGDREGFNVPAGATVDAAGNIYVVDTLNGRVVKLSPEGEFAGEFGRLGQTAGTLSRPKGVAVDSEGRVFVSDGLLAVVEVFGPDGTYLGVIGRREPGDAASGSLFQAPAGLWLQGDKLYVMDRFAGLLVLSLPGETPPAAGGD